ncbi:MAG: hypothetical protein LBM77_02210 [Spirochaetaceae bacterium]|jgi:hypothetical protein|nr:hypothetical protein [Spirochaetaceae bacterium]
MDKKLVNLSDKAIEEYTSYINGGHGFVNNVVTLKSQTLIVSDKNNMMKSYVSDINVTSDYHSGYYYITVMDDDFRDFVGMAILWPTTNIFTYSAGVLICVHGDKTIQITGKTANKPKDINNV